ncbi:sodium-dependent transporter, partial [Fulvivirga kasyanovii]
IGRRAQKDAYGSYKSIGGKNWGMIGLFGILCGIMILSFYNVVAGWAFGYFLEISFGNLLQSEDFRSFFGGYVSDIWDNLFFSVCFMIITAFIVVKGVSGGIERASKILMPMLYVILLGLIVYSLTLDNAIEGIKFYLLPDISKLNLETIYSALGQAFFSLSLGMGALITYGSYIDKKQNIVSSAAMISVMDVSVAFLAGLLIFPLVFSQGQTPSEGPGLVFVALPGVFNAMGPIIGKIVGGGFFLLLCFAALTSTISLLEVPVAYLVDEKKLPRKAVVWLLAAFIFIVGLPSMLSQGAVDAFSSLSFYGDKSFLDFVSEVFSDISLPLGGCLMSIFIAVKWKTHNLSDEISEGNESYKGSFMEKVINLILVYIAPILLALIFINTVLDKFFGLSII